jgi:glutaredoxin
MLDRSTARSATLYRMVTPEHICPFGMKSLDLLKREGFTVEDHPLKTRAETDAFMAQNKVETTPQTLLGGKRVGGYDDLRRYFDKPVQDLEAISYQPVVAVFATALLMALAATWASLGTLASVRSVEWFIAFSMCILAIRNCAISKIFRTCSWATIYSPNAW